MLTEYIMDENADYAAAVKSAALVPVPVFGIIYEDKPLRAEKNIIGYECLPESMAREGAFFGLKVTGDGMNAARICDGDIVIVREQSEIENGETAVVIIGMENAAVKKYFKTGNTVTLVPNSTNPGYQPRIIDTVIAPVKVLGKVVKVIMAYNG